MIKFFQIMDNLPIIRILQVVACLYFFMGLINLFNEAMTPSVLLNNAHGFFTYFRRLAYLLTSAFYQPVLFLALAEIIKLMREKNDKN